MKTPQQPPRTNPSPLTGIGKLGARIPAALAVAATFALTQMADAQTAYNWNAVSGNWSTPANWLPVTGAGPQAGDSVIFGATDTSASSTTVNNTVDAGFAGTIANLTYNSISATGFNVTQIPTGETLTVANTLTVGEMKADTDVTSAYFTGGGTLQVTGPLVDVENFAVDAGGQPAEAFLNLSALSNFVYNNSTGTVSVAGSLTGTRCYGTFLLAGVSNSITAATLNIGTCTGAQAGTNLFSLGSGTNILNVASLNLVAQKNNGFLNFQSTTGGLRVRGVSGVDSDRANITIANHNVVGGSVSDAGSLLMNGSAVNIKAGTLVIAETTGGSGTGTSTGNLQFDTGTVDATTIQMAYCSAGSVGSTANLTVGPNGTLVVGTGGISLANQTLNTSGNGPATGTLNISNGTVICNGNITVATNFGTGNINFLNGGHLTLGLNNTIGTPSAPISSLTLAANSTLEFTVPSATATNIVVNTLTWPTPDSTLTITVDGLIGIGNGSVIPLIQFATINGTFTAPVLNLPSGVTGTLSQTGNTIWLTITGGVGPGVGGQNQLLNPGFELGTADWTTVDAPTFDNTPVISTSPTTFYDNSPSGACGADATAELVLAHRGTNVANMYGQFTGNPNTSSFNQTVATIAGSVFTAGAYAYVSHEDLLSGKNSFFFEVDFLDGGGNLLGCYESTIVTNLTCTETTPFTVDAWNFLAVTNEMTIVGGTNSGQVALSIASGDITAPPGTTGVRFSAKFVQQGPPDQYDGGSIYFDDVNLGRLSGPIPPTISQVTPDLITLCTNKVLTVSAASTVSSISSFQVVVISSTLGGVPTTVTNTVSSPAVTVTGIGSPNATLTYALKTNTVYQSVVIRATDANGVTISSPTNTFDTLVPTLVIEASDFNYQNGQFMDTPPNGGVALYTNQVGVQGVDENKAPRTGAQGYYRPADAVILEGAAPGSGSPPSSTEQKFVTSLAYGDTNDIEMEAGYNSVGDWLNYSRTYGSSGTVSAPSGTYDVWCYMATSGTGPQISLSLLTSSPNVGGQTTNFIGNFGTATFSDNGYNNFVYVPLVDQFGNPVSVTLSNGVQTLKATVLGNPNIGFYMLTPAVPVLQPVLENVSPNGSVPFQASNKFTFTVGPANGGSLSTNGIGLILNGSPVSGGLTFTELNGSITANFTLQSNAVYNAVIVVTNSSGLSSSYTVSFDTFSINDYQVEAVDYDFSTNSGDITQGVNGWIGGQFIDNPAPSGETTDISSPPITGLLETNSYYAFPTGFYPGNDPQGLGAVAQPGVDYFTNAQTGVQTFYRDDDVGSQQATDYVRPKFLAAQTNTPPTDGGTICAFNLGYFNAGNWVNYTRTYPTNTFNVWGRLAGGNGAFSGTTLSRVTSGVGTTNQTTVVLGSFADPNPAGWQAYHWVELMDASNNPAVISLAGKATLRLTSGNNLNAEFLMFTPAPPRPGAFNVAAGVSGGNINIGIPTLIGEVYTVWYSSGLGAAWVQVGGSIIGDGTEHTFTQPASGSQGYYKVKVTPQ